MQHSNQHTKLDERGFASIVIALVLIIVLALLTVGFAQLARREQQGALDKQLASQAAYAAETGVNDAYQDIQSGAIYDNTPTGGRTDTSTTHCMNSSTAPVGGDVLPPVALTANPTVQASNGMNIDVSYTCLLVNLHPPNMQLGDVGSEGQSAVFSTTDTLNQLTITWGAHSGSNHSPPDTSTKFPPSDNWHDSFGNKYTPVVEFSITPLPSAGVTRSGLISQTFNVYLYPAASAGDGGSSCTVNVQGQSESSQCISVASAQGKIVSGHCQGSGSLPCSVTLTGLGDTQYLVHTSSFYDNDPASIQWTGTDPSNNPVDFTGEPMVDVTGKAKDVLKRIQVRFLTSGSTGGVSNDIQLPNNAIESQNICKRFGTEPLSTTFDGLSGACTLDN